ncbi:hypothetical protein G9A89_003561 [Geosiphon pyriformis]|nr:hypothetical protein G9A89_003561 [Geosiphon pyriformis]
MAPQHLISLSNNLAKLLESRTFFDISIEVGEGSDTQIFEAHSAILIARSPYFALALSSDWVKREENVIHFKKPNISPKVFDLILKYIYSGEITLTNIEISLMLELLIAADELVLEEFVEHLQEILIEDFQESQKQKFSIFYPTTFKYSSFKKLQDFCISFAASNPDSLFKSDNFTSIEEDLLISLIRRDDLEMEESVIWDYLLKWGKAKINAKEDNEEWTMKDFQALKMSLQRCFQFVRFYDITSVDFYTKVTPYAESLPGNLYKDLLRHYLGPASHKKLQSSKVKRHPKRKFASNLLQPKHFDLIGAWIKGDDELSTDKLASQEFELLLRGSRDGFTPADFHRLCDNKGATLTIIKVKDTKQLIGGYSPSPWHSGNQLESGSGTFIFSLGDRINGENIKLSRFQDVHGKLGRLCSGVFGPTFGCGKDLTLYGKDFHKQASSYCAKSNFYQYSLMNSIDGSKVYFAVQDYEVFKVVEN